MPEREVTSGGGQRPEDEPFNSPRPSVPGPTLALSTSSHQTVVDWYERKTASILKKYGPGPQVHFHVGIFNGIPTDPIDELETLRRRLVASQEALMRYAAEVWEATKTLSGDVLDIGCGLGGGAIFLAQEYGARVTANTIVPEHITLVSQFARQAGVAERVTPLLADACAVPGERSFDAAMAIESSCYLPRMKWFSHLARLLRPGGYVCIEDSFIGKPAWAEPFNKYWRTNIGLLDEYVKAAEAAGFVLDRNVDITMPVVEFWHQSNRWTEIRLASENLDSNETTRLQQSVRWQTDCYTAWKERGIETRLVRFKLAQ